MYKVLSKLIRLLVIGITVSTLTTDLGASIIPDQVGHVKAATADPQSVNTNEDTPVDITLTGSDNVVCDLTFSIAGSTSNGTLGSITDQGCTAGSPNSDSAIITYTPTGTGSDSFIFQVDNGTETNTATVSITINAAPVVSGISDQAVAEGSSFAPISLDTYVMDTDDADADLNWSYLGNSELTVSIDPSRIANIGIPDSNWNGSESITFVATDPDGLSDSDSATFTVNSVNDAPIVSLTGSTTANEGQTFTYSYTTDDPDPDAFSLEDETCGTGGALSDSNFNSGTGAGSFDCTFPNGPASPVVSVTVSDGTVADSDSINVTVNNVAPTADAGGPYSGHKGSVINFSGSALDPGTDPLTYQWDFDYDGSTFDVDASGSLTPSHTYDNDGSYTAALRVSDDATSTTDTASVTINNVAPTADAGGPYSGNEGSAINFSGSASDPDEDPLTYEWDFDYDGSTFNVDASGSLTPSHIYDNDGSYTAALRVSDNDTSTIDTASVTINNVAPTVSLSGSATADEGQTLNYSYTTSDPGTETFSLQAETCGTGGVLSGSSFTPSTGAGSFNCSFPDGPASPTVSVTVSDDTVSDSDSISVTVNNVAPTAILSSGGPVNEGSTTTVSFSSQSDPSSADTAAGFTYSYDFNNDGTFEIVDSSSASATVPASFLEDGPATRTVKARIKDKDGGFTDYTTDITVNNVAPVVSAGPDGTILQGGTFTYNSGSFTDPGADTWTATVNYGDGTGTNLLTLVGKTFTLSHTYTQLGTFTITVTVSDGDVGGTGTDTVTVTVSNAGLIAENDQYEVDEDDELSVPAPGVLGNDTGPGPLVLTAVLVSDPLSGTLSFNSNGSFIYTPNPNFNGIDSFTYRAKKGIAQSNVATVTITVNPVNDPPQAQDDVYSVMAGETLSKPAGEGVLANDFDVDGDILTAQKVDDPGSGTVILQPDGSFTYTPEIGFTGVVTFTYRASDGIATSNIANVEIEVFDGSEPRVEFTGPVESGDTLDVYNQIVCLKVFAEDDIRIDRVRFYWWNPVALQYFDLSIDDEPPFEACIDTTSFPQGFNQVFAKSYDDSGNESARKWIWLYKVADLWRSLLPFVNR